jgi:hypothetical protein
MSEVNTVETPEMATESNATATVEAPVEATTSVDTNEKVEKNGTPEVTQGTVTDGVLSVSADQMKRIYLSAGFKSAEGWDNKKMTERVSRLGEDDKVGMKSDEDREVFDYLIQVKGGELKLNVLGGKKSSGKSSHSEEGSDMSTTVLEKKTPKEKKAPKEKAPKVEKEATTDIFGCRLGHEPAMINAELSDKPRTAASIAEKLGIDEKRIVNHFKYWQKKNRGIGKFVEEVEGEGWRLNMDK